jgi:tetratricopeptide (TPR) repeat protein
MRRAWILVPTVLLVLAAPLRGQIGKTVLIHAGTPEEKAFIAIAAATDPTEKLALIDKFLADYGQGELAIIAYEQYIAFYFAQKNYDKAAEYAEKLLSVDPDNLAAGVNLLRAGAEKNDSAKVFAAGERISGILARYKAAPPPEGVDAISWPSMKQQNLENAAQNIRYVEYQLITFASQTRDPAARAALFERFVHAFPESAYVSGARDMIATSYQQAQNYPKMVESAEKTLAQDPKHPTLLLLLADYFSEKGEQLDKAENYAHQAIEQLGAAVKPEGVSDADWQKQTTLQKGLAWSALGQVFINQKKDTQALEAFQTAAPLVKPDAGAYARNQYRMGFALINLKRYPEAHTALTEAASVESSYRALAQAKLRDLPAGPARPAKKRP